MVKIYERNNVDLKDTGISSLKKFRMSLCYHSSSVGSGGEAQIDLEPVYDLAPPQGEFSRV